MPDRLKQTLEDHWYFIFKILPYSIAALVMSIVVRINKDKRFDWLNIGTSVSTGLGMAYLTGGYINAHFDPDKAPFIIGFVSIIAKDVAYYFTYVFKFELFGDLIVDYIKKKLSK